MFRFLLLILLTSGSLRAGAPGANAFHLEALGMGGFYSLSWEHRFAKGDWLLQPGLSVFADNGRTFFVLPVLAKKTFGQGPHQLETGIGQGFTLQTGNGAKGFARGLLLVGWRYQRPNRPWIMRVSYTPFISYLIDVQYQHWGGISIGYQLREKS